MKLSFFILCCIFVTIQYESVRGGLVKDFFGQVHDTAQHVRNDVRNVLHINKKDETKNPDEINKVGDETPAKETGNKNEVKPEEGQKEKEDTSVKESEKNDDSKNVEPVQNGKQHDNKTEAKPEESNHNENSESTVTSTTVSTINGTHDGRENFTGACAPGYVRTADGRCKKSF
ncbi:growth-blocking peptide, long form-like [Hyposmocoma kahamanoa]|uniref:growth-blocking peptide, long form-like n=1 Tax=Hyposmocoma kahamanoa TaxID=1477025 RepID=UPI000E6DA2E5|nr:growth-blocking peptide, long form-like [Hyposmocoma kahamanoa]